VLSDSGPDRQGIAFIRVLRTNEGAAAEASAQRLRFDESTGEINASRLPDDASSLYIVVAGSYRKARDALRLRSECLVELDLLKGSFYPALTLPPFYFARIFARRADAETLLGSLAACPELPKPRVVEYRSVQAGEGSNGHAWPACTTAWTGDPLRVRAPSHTPGRAEHALDRGVARYALGSPQRARPVHACDPWAWHRPAQRWECGAA
jgi:hypothetical protein